MSVRKLLEVCDFQGGTQPPKDEWVNDPREGYVRMLQIRDYSQGDEKFIQYVKDTKKLHKCKKDDIMLSRYGYIGQAFMGLEGAYNVALVKVIKKEEIHTPYLLYYFQSNYFQHSLLSSVGARATIPGFNKEELKNALIKIPEMNEQIEIASKIANVEELIGCHRQQLVLFDTLIKSRFIEMFGVQKYQRKALGECTDFVDYRGHTPELSDEGTIRMVNAKSVGKGFFKYIDEYVTEETYDSWMHRGFGYPGDILFVTEGHTFGNTCLIPDDLKKFALGQRVITIKGHKELLNAFLCSYMQTDMFWKDINVYRTGGTAQGIRSKDLVKVFVPIPPLEQQNQFATFVEQTDKSKFEIQQSLEKLETLKKALMQKYFG